AFNHKDANDYEGFRLNAIVQLALDTKITEEEFGKSNMNELADTLYNEAFENYQKHKEEIAKNALPVFKNIRQAQGNQIENVVVPFADGRKALQVLANMQKTIDSNGFELVNSLEKTLMLGFIDDAWKEHLRSMDDLKQSVRTVQYEQKDPLVIYKQEAFGLFAKMNSEVNVEIVTFLSHGNIPVETQQNGQLREGHERKTDLSGLHANKEEIDEAGSDYGANGNDYYDPSANVKQQPVVVGPKTGRNDPCPCGSGKKYKNCHGKDA
ncbi:SEC-C metal-binding domain-containing protein, partial [Arachidicoccus sp.]|uniref:SEC-C metal-binding domain-containing protein n=1 Tax=Arachidicoccus sp. TaxID=1872624 RepID=UPI003D1AA49D